MSERDDTRAPRSGGASGVWTMFVLAAAFAPLSEARAQPAAPAQRVVQRFDVDAQPLPQALLEFAHQGSLGFVLPVGPLEGLTSSPVHGSYTADEALNTLLTNTGLQGRIEGGAVQITPAPPVTPVPTVAPAPVPDGPILVVGVGTNIPQYYPGSPPVVVFTPDDIEKNGATSTDAFVHTWTQNLAAPTQYGPGATIVANPGGINGVDLRGLGFGTTLVLFDGRRLPLASEGQTVDVSLIPLDALERVELLTDGASATYGADAIGGVVNFVPRHGGDGPEFRVRYGGVTSGGLRDGGASFSDGAHWSTGEAFLSASVQSASALDRQDKDFSRAAGAGDLSPADQRAAVVGNFSWAPAQDWSVSGDMLLSRRDVKTQFGFLGATQLFHDEANAGSFSLGVDHDFSADLHGGVTVSAGRRTEDEPASLRLGSIVQSAHTGTDYRSLDAVAEFWGNAGRFGGGQGRFSFGFGGTEQRYNSNTPSSALQPNRIQKSERQSAYAFGEFVAPLIGRARAQNAIDETPPQPQPILELNLAARYSHYDPEREGAAVYDFGDRLSPKVGLAWRPVDWLKLRSSYSQSFRAPSLSELQPAGNRNTLVPTILNGAPALPLVAQGAAPHLDAETAHMATLGFDAVVRRGESRFSASATYFNLDYIGRIAFPDPTNGNLARAFPSRYADIFGHFGADRIEEILRTTTNVLNFSGVNLSDPAAAAVQLASIPNLIVFDNRARNLTDTRMDGLDLTLRYGRDTSIGELTVSGALTYLFDYNQKITANAPRVSLLGTTLRPIDLRAHLALGLSRDFFEGQFTVNYCDDYTNPYALDADDKRVASWTTLDAHFALSLDGASRRTQLSLNIKDVFDEAPPYVGTSGSTGGALLTPVGFDPANADPLGRVITLALVRRW